MSFHNAMDAAVRYADAQYAEATAATTARSALPEEQRIATLGDRDTLTVNKEFIELPPDYVTAELSGVSGMDVLRPMVHAFNEVTGQDVDESWIDEMIQHEGEHWGAAQALGATAGRLIVQVSVSDVIDGKKTFGVQPFTRTENFTTTRLGYGALTARPQKLSKTDMRDLYYMGYPNVFQLTQKIVDHNANADQSDAYPLPFMMDQAKAVRFLAI